MTLSVRLTTTMTEDEMRPLWNNIRRCLQKFVDRFPHEDSVENILKDCMSGARTLWVIQDETGKVVLAPVTEIVRVNATGELKMIFCIVSGDDIVEAMPCVQDMIQWGVEQGCTMFQAIGRPGWKPLVAPYGLKAIGMVYQLRIPNHGR